MENNRIYISIDLKSFYASVECVERGLNPLTAKLVVADEKRTEKTICLAVSPALKAYGIPGRARLFEVVSRIREVNRQHAAEEPITFITATPRMKLYMEYSAQIYGIYLKYIAPEDIHVYSVDEVFMDVTAYLGIYKMTAYELARRMIQDVLEHTGITATAGIGTNLYLSKVAMDIVAKHAPADQDGVRIAQLDEMSYRRLLWNHKPLTDFWRVGRGYARKLQENGMFTMGDVARCSLGKATDYYNEELLYRLFGVNAEFLIDHAWGYEPVTIADIKAYKPESTSISTGQVLPCPYTYEKTKIIVREMTELLVLDLVEKRLYTDQMILNIGYDVDNLRDEKRRSVYHGEVVLDAYGREIPKPAHGSINLDRQTASGHIIMTAVMELFDRLADPSLLTRRISIAANRLVCEKEKQAQPDFEQMNLFTDFGEGAIQKKEEEKQLEREMKMQKAIVDIQKKFGKNAVLKGTNLQEGATTIERNGQVGGHKA